MEELIINIKKCELWTDQLEDYLNKIGGKLEFTIEDNGYDKNNVNDKYN